MDSVYCPRCNSEGDHDPWLPLVAAHCALCFGLGRVTREMRAAYLLLPKVLRKPDFEPDFNMTIDLRRRLLPPPTTK